MTDHPVPLKRPTIGLLISNISDIYTRQIWPGVADTLREKNANLIIFCGNPLFYGSSMLYKHYGEDFSQQPVSSFDYQSNVIYEMIDPKTIDALVLTTGSLSHSASHEVLESFLARLGHIPKVSIAIPLEGIPSVLVDNRKGISDTVDHLACVHGYRKIAFIRGPESHREAQDRYQAYLDSLERNSIPFDKSIVYQGDFMWHSGKEAAKHLLENAKGRFDAVIAANDSMAISAMNYFQSQGMKIPGDIAVCGFDDIELASYSMTPLSTVSQPFYRQACCAAELAVNLSLGLPVPETTVLPAEFINRASCGCLPEAVRLNTLRGSGDTRSNIVPVYSYPVGLTDTEEIQELSSLFLETVSGKTPESAFIEAVSLAALTRIAAGGGMSGLITALVWIRNNAIEAFPGADDVARCERLFENAVIFLSERAQIVPGIELIEYINSDSMLVSVMHGIMSRNQIGDLLDTIAAELPRLNIPGCAISLYEKEWIHRIQDDWKIPGEISLAMSYDRNGRNEPGIGSRQYRTASLIPENFLGNDRHRVLIAEALYFAEEQLGLIFFEMGNTEGMVYELLRLQISNAIKGSLMLHQQQLVQKELRERILTMESELELARKIQSRLIPEKSTLPNVSFYYKPMTKVGGDFFDFIHFRDPDITGFFISDVSGHGVPAAFITSMIKTSLLQIASSTASPSQVLAQLNRILMAQSANNFITAFYGIFNRKERKLIYSFAGHNAPLIISGNGISPLPSSGKALPLAILDNDTLKDLGREYVDLQISLEKDSKLLLYTDGFTEAVNIEEQKIRNPAHLSDFETSGLIQVIENSRTLNCGEFIETVTGKLRDFRGADEYEDDVCVICVDIL